MNLISRALSSVNRRETRTPPMLYSVTRDHWIASASAKPYQQKIRQLSAYRSCTCIRAVRNSALLRRFSCSNPENDTVAVTLATGVEIVLKVGVVVGATDDKVKVTQKDGTLRRVLYMHSHAVGLVVLWRGPQSAQSWPNVQRFRGSQNCLPVQPPSSHTLSRLLPAQSLKQMAFRSIWACTTVATTTRVPIQTA